MSENTHSRAIETTSGHPAYRYFKARHHDPLAKIEISRANTQLYRPSLHFKAVSLQETHF